MLKNVIAAVTIGSPGVVAWAQSNLAIYGVLDVDVAYYRMNGNTAKLVGHSGNTPSQFGLRGMEDLGGGMIAGFTLETALAIDTGVAGGQGSFWNRKSWIGMATPYGELRLGRENSATFWNQLVFDPFNAAGPGASTNISIGSDGNGASSANPLTALFVSNALIYRYGYAPNSPSYIGRGLYFEVQHTLAENASGVPPLGRYTGGRAGYAAGKLNMALAYASSTGPAAYGATGSTRFKELNAGVSYDLGVARLMAHAGVNDTDVANTKYTHWGIGAAVNVGTGGYVPMAYNRTERNNAAGTGAEQLAIGYVHPLSKRTSLYSTVSRLRNKGGGTYSFRGANGGSSGLPGGGTGTGFDVGMKHSF